MDNIFFFIIKLRKEYFSFDGRLNRLGYFIKSIVNKLVLLILSLFISCVFPLILELFLTKNIPEIILNIICLLSVISFLCDLSLGIRRCHDLNKSGWWMLFLLIPFFDIIFILYLLFAKGTDGSNRYGENSLK